MARVGPNQDINDPTTIIALTYDFQQQSNNYGNFLAQSIAQNPNTTGSPIINVSIPFKLTDGSTQLLEGSNIELSESIYIYNENLVSNATLITYINLAERFRDYWATLNNILAQLYDYDYLIEIDIDPEGPATGILPGGEIRIHGSLGGTSYNQFSYSHSPSSPLSIPTWIGNGLTNYNQLTYPQLSGILQSINISRSASEIGWDTIYWYDKSSDASGSVRGSSANFGKHEDNAPPLNEQYIQIYNNESTTMEISLSIDISATFDSRFSTSYASWAEIDDIDVYPNPFGGFKNLLSSYISHNEEKLSPGGTTILSTTRTIEIPPGKSAFIGGRTGAGTTFGDFITIGTVNITIILNDQTLIHSANLI